MAKGIKWVSDLPFAGFEDLCKAPEGVITDGNGFGCLRSLTRDVLETYWSEVLLIPERASKIFR